MPKKKKEIIKTSKKKKEQKEKKLTPEDLLKKVMFDTNKKYKKDVLKFASEEKPKDRIPFNVEKIDDMTGGGSVCGNFVIIYGGKSVGKTSLTLISIANAQKNGKMCALIDLEHSWDEKRAKMFGVDEKKLLLIEDIDNGEQAMDILINLCKNKVIDFIAIDSIQALSPKGEQITKKKQLKSIEDDEMALLARKMSKFLRVANNAVYAGNVAVLMIGQIRVGGLGSFHTFETMTGGQAKDHWSMFILHLRRGKKEDAPIMKVKEYFFDENKKERYKTVDKLIGFDLVVKLLKTKAPNSKVEGTEVHIPYYFVEGFQKIEQKESS